MAATTLHRSFTSALTVSKPDGSGFTVTGASLTDALPDTPLVDAATAALAPATSANAALCKAGTLDPALVTGKLVLCLRGDNDRVDKSRQVKAAGGTGMVLYNATDEQERDTDTHWVPSVHLTRADGLRVKDAIASGATASLTAGHVDTTQPDRVLAAFSSRGPQVASPDIPKPDIAAPGVQILAGAASAPSPVTGLQPGNLFQAIQGTSMASPQVAGAGALLTQYMPTLSPAEIKSELMLTAKPALEEDGTTTATPFEVGSGELDPNGAAHAGLVLNTTVDDYVQYLEFMDPSIVVGDIPKKRPNDLNLPAISFSRLVGKD